MIKAFKKNAALFAILLSISLQGSAQVLKRGFDAVITHNNDSTQIWDPVSGSLIYARFPAAKIIRIGDPIGSALPKVPTANNTNLPNATASVIQPPAWDTLYNIFGVTIDNSKNVYFANTSCYNSSSWKSFNVYDLNGQVQAPLPSVAIYKADGANLNSITNLVTFSSAAIAGSIGESTLKSHGFGLGNVCNHPNASRIYTSNLDDGKIYEFNSSTGKITDIFDPFGADGSGALIAPFGQRIVGVGINTENDGSYRLYYGLQTSVSTNEIWSVKIGNTGGFTSSDNTLEVKPPNSIQSKSSWTVIQDITFSNKGYMAFAERTLDNHIGMTYECYGKHGAWSYPKGFVTGTHSTLGPAYPQNSNGGVTYSSILKGNQLACDSMIWSTANYIQGTSGTAVYGGHSIPSDRLSTTLNSVSNAYVYDNNNSTLDGISTKGGFGDIEFIDSCASGKAIDPCGLLNVYGQLDTNCCMVLELENKFSSHYITGINISSPDALISSVTSGTWGSLNTLTINDAYIEASDGSSIPLGTHLAGTICFTKAKPGAKIFIEWISKYTAMGTVVCRDTLTVNCTQPIDTNCVSLVKDSLVCENGAVTMYAQFKNNGTDVIGGITVHSMNPSITPVSMITSGGKPVYLLTPKLLPGMTSNYIAIPLSVTGSVTSACFYFVACDPTLIVNNMIAASKTCCVDSIQYCVQLPNCNGVNGGACGGAFDITTTPDPSGVCCASLNLINSYSLASLDSIIFQAMPGVSITSITAGVGWNVVPPGSSSFRKIHAPSGVSAGIYTDFAKICINSSGTPPYQLLVYYYTTDTSKWCVDTISFDQCQNISPTCGVIIKDSFYCENNKSMYSFYVQNNGTNPIGQLDLNLDDASKFVATPSIFVPSTLIPIGGSDGPFVAEIDTINGGDANLCFYLSAHNAPYTSTSAPTICCTDSLSKVCYPYVNCKNMECCDFDHITIPNGVTPNADKVNDVWALQLPVTCDSVHIVIYNRWGNKVYEDFDYKNNWGGTNQGGSLLPQGTYFAIIELSNGHKKNLDIDLRY